MSLLEIKGLTKSFGGVIANNDVTCTVDRGKIVGLIGPNGAGKTTLFNCVTGFLPIDKGSVAFNGKNITGLRPQSILRLGIARTFQLTKTFYNMTVLDNVMVGALFKSENMKDAFQIAKEMLSFTGLLGKADYLGNSLTVGDRKRLEIARALATKPTMLMLDEAMAGLNPIEITMATELVRKVRDNGITIVLVEHIMDVVMPLSDWVLVMDQGALLTEGTPGMISKDPRVINAYLGGNWDVTAS